MKSTWAKNDAACNGVRSLLSCARTSAPRSKRTRATSTCPRLAATCSRVADNKPTGTYNQHVNMRDRHLGDHGLHAICLPGEYTNNKLLVGRLPSSHHSIHINSRLDMNVNVFQLSALIV